jgi:hypothetical protein
MRTLNTTHDRFTGIKRKAQGKKYEGRTLCHDCEKIPFKTYLVDDSASSINTPTSPAHSFSSISTRSPEIKPQTYCLNLERVLSNAKWCKFCGLLFHSICRTEYDLFKADHINKNLQSSEKLKGVKTFAQWIKSFSTWEKLTEGEDIWPFGYSRDQKEAQSNAESVAKELFQTAEDRDLESGVLDGMYSTTDELSTALQAAAFGAGVADVMGSGRAFAGMQLITSQMAMFGIGKAKRLPCLFIVRAYQRDEAKAGVLSIRAFAHGRAFHAPLKEICHFSFRLEQSYPRPQGQQLWYGRALGPRIDVPFFERCLVSCQQLHGDVCNEFRWRAHYDSTEISGMFPFRLINVEKMQIVKKDFARVLKPAHDPEHVSYVALSYTWGSQEWTEHTDPEGKNALF